MSTECLLFCIALLIAGMFLAFWRTLVLEGERRASRVALVAVLGSLPFFGALTLPEPFQAALLSVFFLVAVVFLGLYFLPLGRMDPGDEVPKTRFDERDTMFARDRLRQGSPEFEAYYRMRPENRARDDAFRALPGLLAPDARFADPDLFASPEASFFLTEALHPAVDGPVAEKQSTLDPEQMTAYSKDLARYYGALEVGVAETQPYHVYSHVGRGKGTWGQPIEGEYRYAIALTVEMEHAMVAAAPGAATVMESARQYVEAARIAVQLAAALRALGHPARAHIDGHYRVIAPLVGRDAGLGELGRMGLLMTPRHGPRVRIAVVTTEAALVPDGRRPDPALLDFCTICRKCAECCPADAIPDGQREEIDGALRWRIDSDACFHYWNIIGTDCARCLSVCPYAHPTGPFHDLIRYGIARSGFFRRLARWMDDLFYGKKPAPHSAPRWTRVR
ncbi:MAG: 4Fe-4S dicluster domain-containing protein [Anaerolineales bacterium]|nr:4Fe-4S dicluster domain-containing protein [Anaerolineales bacterium]